MGLRSKQHRDVASPSSISLFPICPAGKLWKYLRGLDLCLLKQGGVYASKTLLGLC